MNDRRKSPRRPPGTERRGNERRREKRHPIEIAVTLELGRDTSIHASHNLSRGGVFFPHAVPYPVGTQLRVRFLLPGDDREIHCAGEVVNAGAAKGMGMGVRFDAIDAEDVRRIDRFAAAVAR